MTSPITSEQGRAPLGARGVEDCYTGKALSWETKDGVLELALHHPACNEIGTVLLGELEGFAAALAAAASGGGVGAAIIYSKQAAGFSAGADLRELYAGA